MLYFSTFSLPNPDTVVSDPNAASFARLPGKNSTRQVLLCKNCRNRSPRKTFVYWLHCAKSESHQIIIAKFEEKQTYLQMPLSNPPTKLSAQRLQTSIGSASFCEWAELWKNCRINYLRMMHCQMSKVLINWHTTWTKLHAWQGMMHCEMNTELRNW